jgi:putative acetyltransferase
MKVEIRRANYSDAAKIIEAHRRSIREVCSRDYTSEQIAAWSGQAYREERWLQTIDRDLVWVISDSNKNIYGFGHLQFKDSKEAEIAGLYLVPEVIGKGLGKELVGIMFDQCRKKEIHKVFLSATKTAKKFYEAVGFEQMGEPSSVEINGKKIECLRMRQIVRT